jgi:hypothetical protein
VLQSSQVPYRPAARTVKQAEIASACERSALSSVGWSSDRPERVQVGDEAHPTLKEDRKWDFRSTLSESGRRI